MPQVPRGLDEESAGRIGGRTHAAGFLSGAAEGLLAQHGLARRKCALSPREVTVVGEGDVDRVNLRIIDHGGVVVHGCAAWTQ